MTKKTSEEKRLVKVFIDYLLEFMVYFFINFIREKKLYV